MIVFCPNCGTQNAGLAGTRASCSACGSAFDVPKEAAARPPPVAEAPQPPPPQGFSAPGAQVFTPNPVMADSRPPVARTNSLAIVSLVSGVVCCLPLISPGLAIGCGIFAMKQIEASPSIERGRGLAIAGIILGAITALLQFFWLVGVLTRGH